ncbi:unnamed protein product, partial [Prorocentrum cordatum]
LPPPLPPPSPTCGGNRPIWASCSPHPRRLRSRFGSGRPGPGVCLARAGGRRLGRGRAGAARSWRGPLPPQDPGPRSGRDMPLCVGAGAAAAGGRPMLRLRSDPCLGRPGPGARPPCPEQPPRPRRASTGTVAAPPAPKAPPRPAARRLAPGEPLSPPGRAAEARSPRLRGGPSPRCGGESPRGDSPSFGRLATPAFVWPREPACHSARSAASTTASGSCASCVSCASAASSPGPGSSTSSPEAPREVFAEAEPALRSARAGPCGGRPPAGAAAGGQSRGLGPFLGGAAPRRAGPPRRRGCDMPGMAPLRALCAERSCLKQRVGAEERAAVFEGSVLLRLEEIRLLGRRAAR